MPIYATPPDGFTDLWASFYLTLACLSANSLQAVGTHEICFWDSCMQSVRFLALAGALALSFAVAGAMADSPASFLERFNADARSAGEGPGNAVRGQKFFNQTLVFVGLEWSYFRGRVPCKWMHRVWPQGRTIDKIKFSARVSINTV